jgi:hypothetical protein
MEAALGHLREDLSPVVQAMVDNLKAEVQKHRNRVIGEISAIEVELRTQPSRVAGRVHLGGGLPCGGHFAVSVLQRLGLVRGVTITAQSRPCIIGG